MTEYEHYKEQIERFTRLGLTFGLNAKTDEINQCKYVECTDCKFYDDCVDGKLKWADEEHQEAPVDWSKVPIDTKVLVSNSGEIWNRRYFAGVDDKGEPLIWYDGVSSWSTGNENRYGKYKYVKLAEED